jgi:hypothetical protein
MTDITFYNIWRTEAPEDRAALLARMKDEALELASKPGFIASYPSGRANRNTNRIPSSLRVALGVDCRSAFSPRTSMPIYGNSLMPQ